MSSVSKRNPANKLRDIDTPYAHWRDLRTGIEYKLLKSWQGNNRKDYARWFVAAKSLHPLDEFDFGDEYVRMLLCGIPSSSVTFDETVWSSLDEFIQWAWGRA